MVEATASDIQARAQRALAESPISELRQLQIEQHDSVLVLRGVVSRFYHKQVAQEVVRAICAQVELDLVNAIEVCP